MKYSLRSLLIAVTLICVTLGSLSLLRYRTVSRLRAVETIEALGGSVSYDDQDKAMAPRSDLAIDVGRWLGDERAFSEVRCVTFYGRSGSNFGDEELSVLRHFPRLRLLHLDNTRVSDEGLKRVSEFHELEELVFTGRPLTMAGIENLGPLIRQLRWIQIDASSDAAICKKVTNLLRPGGELSLK